MEKYSINICQYRFVPFYAARKTLYNFVMGFIKFQKKLQ